MSISQFLRRSAFGHLVAVTAAIVLLTFVWMVKVSAGREDKKQEIESKEVSLGTIPFVPGNLVVCRVGDGAAALTNAGTLVFLDEYTPTGTFVRSVPVPSGIAGNRLVMVGNSTTECEISRSVDGRYIILAGYDAAPGATNPSASDSTTVPRVLGRVDQAVFFDLSTKTSSFSTQNIRSAASTDGINFWAVGSGTGTVFTTLGSTGAGTVVTSTLTNSRTVNIFGSQLYTSSGSGALRMNTVGTGTPTTTGQTTTTLPGLPTATVTLNAFVFLDLSPAVAGLDTLYVADDQSTTAGTIRKYSLVGGTWNATGTLDAGAVAQYRGLTASSLGTSVTLYATRGGNELVSIVDASGYNGTLAGTPTSLATAGTNTAFRGVVFAPQATTAAEVSLSGRVLTSEGRGITNARVTITGDSLPEPRVVLTGRRGFYVFEGLNAGDTYIVTVSSRRFIFSVPSRVITLMDNATDFDFVSDGQ